MQLDYCVGTSWEYQAGGQNFVLSGLFFSAEMQHYNIVTSRCVENHRFWRNLLCKEQNQRFPEGAALEGPAVGSFPVQISHGSLCSCHWRNEWHVGFVHWTQNRSWATWILFLLFLLIVVTLNRLHEFFLCLIFQADKIG